VAYIEEPTPETDVEIAAEPETDAVEQALIHVAKPAAGRGTIIGEF